MSEPLLKALEALHSDLGSLRDDLGSARAEASAAHLETIAQIGAMSECLRLINTRVAGLEAKRQGSGVRAAVTGVGELAKAAILG